MIRPTAVHEDGSADALFDELGHTGTLPASEIVYGTHMDGSPNPDILVLTCPDGCGSVSYHPRSSSDPLVQQLFASKEAA